MKFERLPKKIWMYWRQGEENAPLLVKKCILSWRHYNPDWEVEVLDQARANDLVKLSEFDQREDISLQALSDILRVELLTEYGGVWADASLFCVKPLNDWLFEYMQDDFFAFASKRCDRLMTTWFLAAGRESATLKAWTDAILDYWQSHVFKKPGLWSRRAGSKLMSLRKRGLISNNFWFSAFVIRFLGIYPYPVNMYLFERALDGNPSLKETWLKRNALFDEPAEHLQNILGMNNALTEVSERYLQQTTTPVHKLNWRQDLGEVKEGSNFAYLLKLADIN